MKTYLFPTIVLGQLIIILFLWWSSETKLPTETPHNPQDSITIANLTDTIKTKDSLLQVNSKHDTIIQVKWKIKIDSIEVYTMPQYAIIYDSITGSQVLCLDSLICFDSLQLKTITQRIYEGQECKERFVLCQNDKVLLQDKYFAADSISKVIQKQSDKWQNGFNNAQEAYSKERKWKMFWRGANPVSFLIGVLVGGK